MHDGRGGAGGAWLGLDLPPGTEVAGFVIEGRLATGSFGGLYRARRGARRFALKLVPDDARGEREVDALRRVRALPVVGFHGYGLWPDDAPRFLVLALELVEGVELDVWARAFNPSARELLERVVLPLVDILGQVHAAGVVHRDVKEANIVIRHPDGQPVLVDFGAASCAGAPRLTQRLPPGTPEYRSPELLRFAREWEGEPPPERSGDDLWALGVTLYALLTRALPFGTRQGALVDTILEATPPPPHERNPCVPPALGRVCLRLLEKRPEARCADAATLGRELREALAQADGAWDTRLFPGERHVPRGEPVPVLEPGPERRWVRPLALGLCAVLALCLAPASRWLTPEVHPPGPPGTLSVPSPTQREISRQELEPERMTGEVVSNAGPRTSPSPAPVAPATHPLDTPMRPVSKRNPVMGLTLAATLCTTPACVGGPQKNSTMTPCPKGSVEAMRDLGLRTGTDCTVSLFGKQAVEKKGGTWPNAFLTRNGPIKGTVHPPCNLGQGIVILSGEMMLINGQIISRFYELHLPSGKVVPVCMENKLDAEEEMLLGGGTLSRPFVLSAFDVTVKDRFDLNDALSEGTDHTLSKNRAKR